MITAINMKKTKRFLLCLAISLGVGALSSLLIKNAYEFYSALILPAFAPKAWVFPVVWTILYVLMGIASYLVARDGLDKSGVREAIRLYALNLIFLFLWPLLFFKFHLVGFSAIWIVLSLVIAAVMAVRFYDIHKAAGGMMGLLVLWILFAAILNVSIWWLNKA